MENNQLSTDQVSTNAQDNPVNGINISSKVFVGHSSPTQVARTNGVKHNTSSSDSKEVSGSALLPSKSHVETSKFLLTSTPSASLTGGTALSGGTPQSDGLDRKPIYSRNDASVDRRSNKIRSSMKSSSVISGSSPASITNGNHGLNISPGSLSNSNRSGGLSTSDSIFTYSLTDESHDELDEADCKGDEENEAKKKTLDSTVDAKVTDLQDELNVPAPCDINSFVDKIAQVKNVIKKEYIHTITYTLDDLTSFEKNCSILNSEICQSHDAEQLHHSSKKNPQNLFSADQKELGHKKFSVKNFLKSMSPGSRHREASKSSESVSSRSTNTLAGSVDSASVSEDLEEAGATVEMKPKACAAVKKSPRIGKKSPTVSRVSRRQKSKGTTCDPVTDSLQAGEASLSGDCQIGGK